MTTFQIRVDKDLKDQFLLTSKKKGLDGSVLIRYFMETFTQKPDIVQFHIQEDMFDHLLENQNIRKKLKKVSHKLDTLGF
ncbi:hypothetical protein MK079_03820 [Candidatus Gracilibacteria bacterium]|nr:hypothetical protein [Candidatus Gracilibacteria bacterium]